MNMKFGGVVELFKSHSSKFYMIHLIVFTITVACILMNGPMRGGLPIDTTAIERMNFIVDNKGIWQVSWLIWMLSAIGLFIFCAIFKSLLKPTTTTTVALSLVAMGIAPDLIAEVLYAFVMPETIVRFSEQNYFEFLEIISMHLTGFLGNGLYNLGGMGLTIAAINQGLIKSWVAMWGLIAWTLGLMLSVSVAFGSIFMAEIFTATSMVLSTLWMLVIAYKVLPR